MKDMSYVFRDAASFNQDLCAWSDTFPYDGYFMPGVKAGTYSGSYIFSESGCTFQNTPQLRGARKDD